VDSVSRLNQAVLLLRKQLLERSKQSSTRNADPGGGNAHSTTTENRNADPLQRTADLRNAGIEDEQQLSRRFVESVLLNELGQHLVSDAGMQQVITLVLKELEDDEESKVALKVIISELK